MKVGDRQAVLNKKSPTQKDGMKKRIPLKETHPKETGKTTSKMETETITEAAISEQVANVSDSGVQKPFVFESQRPNVPIAPGSLSKAVNATMLEFRDTQDTYRIGAEIMERMVGYEKKGLYPEKLENQYGLAGISMCILANVVNLSKESAAHFAGKCSHLETSLKETADKHDQVVSDIIAGNSKMSQELQDAKNAAEDLMKERTILNQKVQDLTTENDRLKKKLNNLANAPMTVNSATRKAIIDDAREDILNEFRASADFFDEIKKIAEPMFDEGGWHIMRFLYGKGLPLDNQTACDAMAAEFFDPECLEGYKMVPFAEADLLKSQAKHSDWIVPDAAESNIPAMFDKMFSEPMAENDGGEVEEEQNAGEEV